MSNGYARAPATEPGSPHPLSTALLMMMIMVNDNDFNEDGDDGDDTRLGGCDDVSQMLWLLFGEVIVKGLKSRSCLSEEGVAQGEKIQFVSSTIQCKVTLPLLLINLSGAQFPLLR